MIYFKVTQQLLHSIIQISIPFLNIMSQLPNIIFTEPNYNYPAPEGKKEHTPIKQLSIIRSIDDITHDYLSLFGHVSSVLEYSESQLRNSNKQMKESAKRSNIGMKIKQRLESKTKNRYQPLLTFLSQQQSSQIEAGVHDEKSLCSQKLYINDSGSMSSHKQEKVQQILIQKISQKSRLSNFEGSKKKDQSNKQTRQHTSGSSKNSSAYTYNNISAKTYYSSAQSGLQSPIQKLNNLCEFDSPSVKEFQLDKIINEGEAKQSYNGFFKLKQVQCELKINNIRLAQSGVWETPHQNTKNNQSVYFSCQDNHNLTPLQYAMKQLQKLKENVDELEKAANNLIVTKILSVQSSVILPSPIDKEYIQGRDFCSFFENLQQNYRQAFDIQPQGSKQQSLLIEQSNSRHSNACKSYNYITKQPSLQNQRIIFQQPFQLTKNILQQVQNNETISTFNRGLSQISKNQCKNKINMQSNKQNDSSYLK